MTKQCQKCGKNFHTYPSCLKRGRGKYCSKDCRRTGKVIQCANCGKQFYRPQCELRLGRGFFFCSLSCNALFYGERRRKHAINFDFFEHWSPELAYWLGLMITDGNVHKTRASFCSKDKELAEFIRDCMVPTKPLKKKEITSAGNIIWFCSAYSKSLVDKLSRFAIVPKKSKIAKLPPVPNGLKWHLVRGILDGDGSIDKHGTIIFCSASKALANQLWNLLQATGLDPRRRKMSSPNYYQIALTLNDSRTLAALIYKNNPFCLQRKKRRLRPILEPHCL